MKGLKVENLIRPEEPRNFFTIGPYVLWGQSFGPAAIINPEPVLAVQEASTGTWELLLEEGEWARLMKHTPEEIPGKFRTHPALQGNAYQMIEEEGARFEHLSMRFGDDGELGLWANYEVTVCCRRSCSIGPLETFSISLDIELEGMIGKLERWRRAPEPVRGYFIKYGEEARRGWSGLAGEADLERAYTAFLDP